MHPVAIVWGSVGIAVVVTVIVNILLHRRERIKNIVSQNSTLLCRLAQINNDPSYQFLVFSSVYPIRYCCASKREFDRIDLTYFLVEQMQEKQETYKTLIESVQHNNNAWNSYTSAVNTLVSTADDSFCRNLGVNPKIFRRFENSIFLKNIKAKPTTDVTIICSKHYSSPSGRNQYSESTEFNYDIICRMLDGSQELLAKREERQAQIQAERNKMTASLRYQILKRDGFRCRACGSSADDGAKLHVDHIVPVAKGGLTIEDNLQTLCERCNLGKSDRF